jgi:hypothetical protein
MNFQSNNIFFNFDHLPKQQQKGISMACSAALNSQGNFNLGSAIFSGSTFMTDGFSSADRTRYWGTEFPSTHAEISSLYRYQRVL